LFSTGCSSTDIQYYRKRWIYCPLSKVFPGTSPHSRVAPHHRSPGDGAPTSCFDQKVTQTMRSAAWSPGLLGFPRWTNRPPRPRGNHFDCMKLFPDMKLSTNYLDRKGVDIIRSKQASPRLSTATPPNPSFRTLTQKPPGYRTVSLQRLILPTVGDH